MDSRDLQLAGWGTRFHRFVRRIALVLLVVVALGAVGVSVVLARLNEQIRSTV